ncbi:TPA: hypothetical protein SI451_000723 [Escherichia coli]|nr:hypothetical protein [Escherichia coli]HEI3782747.1 hypothetical protein [Escherichia coli]
MGEPKGSPVGFSGYANPVRLTTSLIGVRGGDNLITGTEEQKPVKSFCENTFGAG